MFITFKFSHDDISSDGKYCDELEIEINMSINSDMETEYSIESIHNNKTGKDIDVSMPDYSQDVISAIENACEGVCQDNIGNALGDLADAYCDDDR